MIQSFRITILTHWKMDWSWWVLSLRTEAREMENKRAVKAGSSTRSIKLRKVLNLACAEFDTSSVLSFFFSPKHLDWSHSHGSASSTIPFDQIEPDHTMPGMLAKELVYINSRP